MDSIDYACIYADVSKFQPALKIAEYSMIRLLKFFLMMMWFHKQYFGDPLNISL